MRYFLTTCKQLKEAETMYLFSVLFYSYRQHKTVQLNFSNASMVPMHGSNNSNPSHLLETTPGKFHLMRFKCSKETSTFEAGEPGAMWQRVCLGASSLQSSVHISS